MKKLYKGSCLCGEVRFVVDGISKHTANCYCITCRKFHGAAYSSMAAVSGLKWLTGERLLKHFTAPNGTVRTFCSQCGASLGFRPQGIPLSGIELAIATFDENIPVSIDAHIYTHYKANWSDILGGLPQFPEGRDI